MNYKNQIEKAAIDEKIIRIYRESHEDGWAHGWVVGVGEEFFIIEVIDENCRLNGFNCFRYCDVTELCIPAPHEKFLKDAITARGLVRNSDLDIKLSSLQALIQSAGEAFPIITIHIDDVCLIGKVVSVTEKNVELICVDLDAQLDKEQSSFALSDIHSVDFGGAYEEALCLVGNIG